MNATPTPVLITVEHPASCLTCGEEVPFGHPAYWIQGVGIWHKMCSQPRNLAAYVREAEARKKLGL